MKLPYRILFFALAAPAFAAAQAGSCAYWQQAADYVIEAQLDPLTHQYSGTQRVTYVNNSPDTLDRIWFHLYFNAFQPGSMMDVRSQTIEDPDRRVGSRIAALSPEEEGFLHLTSLKQDGAALESVEEETIVGAPLAEMILPGDSAVFELTFEGQVPVQIRRSGRDNAEGVDYSMSQWYPKVVEYDYMGWHTNPYVGREFHGVWGDFDVTVALPSEYVFAGTGYARDADMRFADKALSKLLKRGKYTAHRHVAPRVHDFTWAADTDYKRIDRKTADGINLEFFYIPSEATNENWQALPAIMDAAFGYINQNFGQYPYEKYAFIQGGDGGMEYAMCTLITGERNLRSLVGVSVHELMHSWYQFLLATNESLYPWMDEGFTSFASAEVMNHLAAEGLLPGSEPVDNPHAGSVSGYARFANTGRAEALSTHADHYTTNAAYGVGSYVKGELFLYQLRSLIGEEAFGRALRRYFNEWKFRHPTPNDVIRIMEKESGQELDWYLQYMMNTTHQIDHAVDSVFATGKSTTIRLRRVGQMPFPVDVAVETTGGETMTYHIPLVIQRGHVPLEGRTLAPDWPWTHPTYDLSVPVPLAELTRVSIDAGLQMSEANLEDNVYPPTAAE